MSEKISLTGEQIVAGNIKDFQQLYEIFYYPTERSLVDKIALYIYLANKEKQYAKRSIYFSSIEQLKEFIIDLVMAYFYFIDKRIKPDIPLDMFRRIRLSSFLNELGDKQLMMWRKLNGYGNITKQN